MVAKTSPARRRAFFAGLAATGNYTIAAARAKVSRSWVQLHRSTDPEFRAAGDAAVAAARARLQGAGGSAGLPPALRYLAGEELVVRGGNGRRAVLARANPRQWSASTERVFLAQLAASCNVKLACAAVGLTPASAYNHRRRWTGFARAWDEALDIGYVRLEAELVRSACNLMEGVPVDPQAPLRGMTVEQAIQQLKFHQGRLHGGRGPGRPGRWARPRTLDEVRDSILRKIERIRSHAQIYGKGAEEEPEAGSTA